MNQEKSTVTLFETLRSQIENLKRLHEQLSIVLKGSYGTGLANIDKIKETMVALEKKIASLFEELTQRPDCGKVLEELKKSYSEMLKRWEAAFKRMMKTEPMTWRDKMRKLFRDRSK